MYMGNLGFDPMTAAVGLSVGGKLVKGIFGGGPPDPAKLRAKSDALSQQAADLQVAGKTKKAAKKLAKSQKKLSRALEVEAKNLAPATVAPQVTMPDQASFLSPQIAPSAPGPAIVISSGAPAPAFIPDTGEQPQSQSQMPPWLLPALGIGAALLLGS